MPTNAYLKIISSVIAVELLVLIVKPNVPQPIVSQTSTLHATQAGYNVPNALNQTPPETMNVRIVGVDVPDRQSLPVLIYNPYGTPLKVQVTNEVQLKKPEE